MTCRHQNGEITGYSVRYGEEGSSEGNRTVKMIEGHGGWVTTISELRKEKFYTVQIAGRNSAGTGRYSRPVTVETPAGGKKICS